MWEIIFLTQQLDFMKIKSTVAARLVMIKTGNVNHYSMFSPLIVELNLLVNG